MTGMDVLRRCSGYGRDMERLMLRHAMAMDAVMQVTRGLSASGHGSGADRMGSYAARKDALERAMSLRTRMYEMELCEAARLVTLIEPAQGRAIYLRMVRGMTVRQTAGVLHASEDSVRGLTRRAVSAMNGLTAELGAAYEQCQREYAEMMDAKGEART